MVGWILAPLIALMGWGKKASACALATTILIGTATGAQLADHLVEASRAAGAAKGRQEGYKAGFSAGIEYAATLPRCQSTTQRGYQCNRPAAPGVSYCWQHTNRDGNRDDNQQKPLFSPIHPK